MRAAYAASFASVRHLCEHMFVRWEEQTLEKLAEAPLPGYADAVTRTFDAPEALDIRFHEIHTKSALNHVPVSSRVPFSWTVNPYRGFTHACVLLCPSDARVPRVRRRAGLRAGDHRQGQRPGGPAGRARAPVVARRARRAGHQHGSVSVGRGPLQAHAQHLGGDA